MIKKLLRKPENRSTPEGSHSQLGVDMTDRRKGRTEVSAPSLCTCRVLARRERARCAGRAGVGMMSWRVIECHNVSSRGRRVVLFRSRLACLRHVCHVCHMCHVLVCLCVYVCVGGRGDRALTASPGMCVACGEQELPSLPGVPHHLLALPRAALSNQRGKGGSADAR